MKIVRGYRKKQHSETRTFVGIVWALPSGSLVSIIGYSFVFPLIYFSFLLGFVQSGRQRTIAETPPNSNQLPATRKLGTQKGSTARSESSSLFALSVLFLLSYRYYYCTQAGPLLWSATMVIEVLAVTDAAMVFFHNFLSPVLGRTQVSHLAGVWQALMCWCA